MPAFGAGDSGSNPDGTTIKILPAHVLWAGKGVEFGR